MGYLASQGSSNAVGDEVVDFTYPPFCLTPTTPPNANFNATQTTAVCPGSVKFNDTSTDTPQSWLWNFGDGGTSTQQNPTHVYAQPGQYSVKLVVMLFPVIHSLRFLSHQLPEPELLLRLLMML
jgi:PKD repeat protein